MSYQNSLNLSEFRTTCLPCTCQRILISIDLVDTPGVDGYTAALYYHLIGSHIHIDMMGLNPICRSTACND